MIGKGRRGGEQEGKGTQEDCSATWLKVFGFKVTGLVSGSEPEFLKVLMKRQGLKKTPHPLTKPRDLRKEGSEYTLEYEENCNTNFEIRRGGEGTCGFREKRQTWSSKKG